MNISVTLTQAEMKEALIEYVKARKGFQPKHVHMTYYAAGNDPRETSSFSATVSE